MLLANTVAAARRQTHVKNYRSKTTGM